MCHDHTRQKYLLLNAFRDGIEPVSKKMIRKRMKSGSAQFSHDPFGAEIYVNFPQHFDKAFKAAVDDGLIYGKKPDEWEITKKAIKSRDTTFRMYIEPKIVRTNAPA